MKEEIVIIGSGPAGMGCAYALGQAKKNTLVIEREDSCGGLCRTISFNGYLFDIGGHRFLSDHEEIKGLWDRVMGSDMLRVKRQSRIYYRRKYFNYPLSFFNTFWNLGIFESALCVGSYLWCKALKPEDDSTYEGWIINRFGSRLYDIFFKSYNKKVWDISCRELSADWAAERIRGLSLRIAIQDALNLKYNSPKTLAEEFRYPRTGPGEFYRRFGQIIADNGTQTLFNNDVVGLRHDNRRVLSVESLDRETGALRVIRADHVFSSAAITDLIKLMDPHAPAHVLDAAEALSFRSFLAVNIILDKKDLFPDQWIYVHSPDVRLCRIQNYKNWSPAMVADFHKTALGLEYFCSPKEPLWGMNDIDLIDYAVGELEKIGIRAQRHLISGFVVRYKNAYPVYSCGYLEKLGILKQYLAGFENLQTMGRGGLFRYDNSDRALLSGIYSGRKYCGQSDFDVWSKELS